MALWIGFGKMVILIWIIIVIVMLPVYFFRKYKNINAKENTIKVLLVKSLIASIIVVFVLYSGLIIMYFSEG